MFLLPSSLISVSAHPGWSNSSQILFTPMSPIAIPPKVSVHNNSFFSKPLTSFKTPSSPIEFLVRYSRLSDLFWARACPKCSHPASVILLSLIYSEVTLHFPSTRNLDMHRAPSSPIVFVCKTRLLTLDACGLLLSFSMRNATSSSVSPTSPKLSFETPLPSACSISSFTLETFISSPCDRWPVPIAMTSPEWTVHEILGNPSPHLAIRVAFTLVEPMTQLVSQDSIGLVDGAWMDLVDKYSYLQCHLVSNSHERRGSCLCICHVQ
mmetsp:Transcript_4747/g.8518  ORF Transcript_4747/g.8518 Transcript_4747/m.8518 type:complete len:266 (+) Transcript_4747:2612-3409(+)